MQFPTYRDHDTPTGYINALLSSNGVDADVKDIRTTPTGRRLIHEATMLYFQERGAEIDSQEMTHEFPEAFRAPQDHPHPEWYTAFMVRQAMLRGLVREALTQHQTQDNLGVLLIHVPTDTGWRVADQVVDANRADFEQPVIWARDLGLEPGTEILLSWCDHNGAVRDTERCTAR